MNIVLFGLPASGKGTQSAYIQDKFGLQQLSTGDLLRRLSKEDSQIGEKIRSVPTGHFASDELIIEAIKDELKNDKYKKGVIFDGFPRTEEQANKMISMGIVPDAVVFIKSDEQKLKERAINRRIHAQSGRIYNTVTNPPKIEGIDDITGDKLIHRDDDREEFIDKRFTDFKEKTLPAFTVLKSLCKYGSGPVLVEVNGDQDKNKVSHDLNIGLKSVNAIHNIRKNHTFSLIQTQIDFNKDNLQKDDVYIRKAMHTSLMNGEIPFSPYLLYSQPNILNLKDKEQKELMKEITKRFIDKFDKFVIYIDKDNTNKENNVTRKINGGKEIIIDQDTNDLLNYAYLNNKKIELRRSNQVSDENSLEKSESIILDLPKTNINNGQTLNSIQNKPEFVIIESPYAGTPEDIQRNEYYARAAVNDCLNKGEIPVASHLLYTQPGILDDTQSAQRRLGIEAGLITGYICSKSVMYANYGMSPGMEEGVERAKREGRTVEIRNIENFENLYEKQINKKNIKKNKPGF